MQSNTNFIELNRLELIELIKGGFVSSFNTENLTIAFTQLRAGTEIPLHQHKEEAIDIILEGELIMDIGERTGVLNRGMISVVPSEVPHKAAALTDCKVVTIFNPPRKF